MSVTIPLPHPLRRTHTFTRAFREGSDVAEWPVVYTATSGHKGPSIIAAPRASVLAGGRAAPGRSPKLLLPPNKPSRHSAVPGLPSLEKSPDPTCLHQPMAPGQGTAGDASPHRAPCGNREALQLFHAERAGLEPLRGKEMGGLRLSARGEEAPLNQKGGGSAPALLKQEDQACRSWGSSYAPQ